jgi:hypothetical protein
MPTREMASKLHAREKMRGDRHTQRGWKCKRKALHAPFFDSDGEKKIGLRNKYYVGAPKKPV